MIRLASSPTACLRQFLRASLMVTAVIAHLALRPLPGTAQQASLQGIVTSSISGGPVEGAGVALEAAGVIVRGAVTNRNGFYQIGGIPAGTYTLVSGSLGHVEHIQTLTFAPGQRLTVNFQLEASAVALEEVVVAPGQGPIVRDMGRQRVTPGDIRLVPVPAGSGDLASYLQTLPGVVTTGDRGGQLFVRGGTSAENLVLVDGIPIYQPFHILGFFSIFPEDLVSSVDFYAGGFGARYNGRTSSVIDVQMRDGNPNGYRGVGSASPFLTDLLVEGPLGTRLSWIASARRSLIEETSESLLGSLQPITFSSQLLKLSFNDGDALRCSVLALNTSDRGRLDPEDRVSQVSWGNRLFGARCVELFAGALRLVEANFTYSKVDNAAVSRGSSRFSSQIRRMQHDLHSTTMIGTVPLYAGYYLYLELTDFDLTELFGLRRAGDQLENIGGYSEVSLPIGDRIEVRPGVVVTALPRLGVEPRLRAAWEPFGRPSEKLQGAVGLYRQDLVGTSDMRDVSSVFVAWMRSPDEVPVQALHANLGWQQSVGDALQFSVEGYYKQLKDVPVPRWSAVAQFSTVLGRADGEVHGLDARVQLTTPTFSGFVGYGYGSVLYKAGQVEFGSWFGESVQSYHPPHDRRHQVNAVGNLDVAGFEASVRWQLGTGLPYTKPLGFDEAFDYASDLQDVSAGLGTPRLVLDKPFTGRLPIMHRLDISLQRGFDLSFGRLELQAGAINTYDRQNMFYYDLFSARRVDQLPLAPYAAITLRSQ